MTRKYEKSSKAFKEIWQDEVYKRKMAIIHAKNLIVEDTPIEIYNGIYVKREDLCARGNLPPFSKVRGVLEYMIKLQQKGITTVGYTETSISMAGIAVASIAKKLKMTAVIFDPQYKETPDILAYHRKQWAKFGATIIPIKAGMAKVNWYICKQILENNFDHSLHLPLGLPFEETIESTAREVKITLKKYGTNIFPSVVTCVGSGTIAAGILKGLATDDIPRRLYGVMTRSGNETIKKTKIHLKSGIQENGLFKSKIELIMINPKWEYTQKSLFSCPFPCHPYYDLKAWEWLIQNRMQLIEPILFWNIGH